MEIMLIRHFMTPGNVHRRFIGTTDESLLPGQTAKIPYPDVRAVAVSSLKRCIETAEIIYPGVRRYVCSELRECDFGIFENRSHEELKDDPVYQRWLLTGGRASLHGGEDMKEFRDRCAAGFSRMAEQFIREAYGSAAFVVHGGTIMAVLDRFAHHEEGFYHWKVENGHGYHVKLDADQWLGGVRRLTEIERI